jgi:hypothetical protein
MKLKNVLLALICLFAFSLSVKSQDTAYRIVVYGSLPAYCNPLNGDVMILSTTGQAYQCNSVGNWVNLGMTNGGQLIFNQGTITGGSSPYINQSVTWNNGATSFNDLVFNITSTASAYPGSNFLVYNLNASPVFSVDLNGDIENSQPTQTVSNPWLTHTSTWNAGGVTFVDDFRNITSTASAAGSLLAQWQVGSANVFTVSKAGIVTAGGFADNSECFSGAQPAVCAAATSGMAAIANGTASTIVDTSAVTANSVIHVVQDNSIGAKISQTCTATGIPLMVTARTPGTSFTVSTSTGGNVAANYECFTFTIRN